MSGRWFSSLNSRNRPHLKNQDERVESLQDYQILDSEAEESFDDLTRQAAEICQTPICTLGFLDRERIWLKSKVGINETSVPIDMTICQHTAAQNDVYIVEDARRSELHRNLPHVQADGGVRFYAGVPIFHSNGNAIGALCVIDTVPRGLTEPQKETLRVLSKQITSLLESRKAKLPAKE